MFRSFLCLVSLFLIMGCNNQIPVSVSPDQKIVASTPNACLRLSQPADGYNLPIGTEYTNWSWIVSPTCPSGTITYQVLFDGVVQFTQDNTTRVTYGKTLGLGRHTWQVNIKYNYCGSCVGYSETRRFSVYNPTPVDQIPVQLVSPAAAPNPGWQVNNPVTFIWKRPCKTQTFRIYVDDIMYPYNTAIASDRITLSIPYYYHHWYIMPNSVTSGCLGVKIPNTVSELRTFYVNTQGITSAKMTMSVGNNPEWSWLSK